MCSNLSPSWSTFPLMPQTVVSQAIPLGFRIRILPPPQLIFLLPELSWWVVPPPKDLPFYLPNGPIFRRSISETAFPAEQSAFSREPTAFRCLHQCRTSLFLLIPKIVPSTSIRSSRSSLDFSIRDLDPPPHSDLSPLSSDPFFEPCVGQ